MRRTSIFMNPAHLKELAAIGKSQGLKPAHLVRIAIAQFIQRDRRKQVFQIVIPGRARRQALAE